MEVGVSLAAESWKRQEQAIRAPSLLSACSSLDACRTGATGLDGGYPQYRPELGDCARIRLRKQRGAEYKIINKDLEEGKKNIKHIWVTLTQEDIIAAYDRGEDASVVLVTNNLCRYN